MSWVLLMIAVMGNGAESKLQITTIQAFENRALCEKAEGEISKMASELTKSAKTPGRGSIFCIQTK